MGHHRQGHADRRVERGCGQSVQRRQSRPVSATRSKTARRSGSASAPEPRFRRSPSNMSTATTEMPRLQEALSTSRSVISSRPTSSLDNVMEVPRMDQDRGQHGCRRSARQPQEPRVGHRRSGTVIAGQKPVATKAKKSLASFKLRQGNAIGCQGHPSWRPDVGVLRSAGHSGHSPNP